MMSPYGMPLSGGGPEGPGPFGPGGNAPRGSGAAPDRRRKTLIASALAVVAVVGIGGAVAVMSHDPPKHPSAALAGAGATDSSSGAGDGSAVAANGGGKPDGDTMVANTGNGAQGAALNPGGGPTTGGQPGQNTTPNGGDGSAPGGKPVTAPATSPGHPGTTVPGAPAANPAPSAPKPSVPSTSAAPKPPTAPPSSDCTYLDLPASQMPTIKEGSTNVNAVKELQCLLKKSELGIKPLAIDGSWGSDTQSAMTAFQSCNNSPTVKTPGGTPPYPMLAVDGVAGPQTWADLYFWDNQYFNGTSYYCNGTR